MARDKLGPLSDKDFERDFSDIPDIERAYRPGFMQNLSGKVSGRKLKKATPRERVTKKDREKK